MERKYQIWDKKTELYTPVGEPVSPEDWIAQYGWIKNPRAVPVVGGGLMTGSFSGELNQMKSNCERMGAVFDEGLTNEELLEAIEDFENELNAPVDPADLPVTPEERTAAALEFMAMNSLPDEA